MAWLYKFSCKERWLNWVRWLLYRLSILTLFSLRSFGRVMLWERKKYGRPVAGAGNGEFVILILWGGYLYLCTKGWFADLSQHFALLWTLSTFLYITFSPLCKTNWQIVSWIIYVTYEFERSALKNW